ncbi:peptidoglycan recognition protein [Streptomyces sp. NPDC051940]|uniref:peptidoglycan recognition protein n=1 Tax=Streptomyces sp. NPDC051940 TaxID=3155675 RepID=UPI00343212D4
MSQHRKSRISHRVWYTAAAAALAGTTVGVFGYASGSPSDSAKDGPPVVSGPVKAELHRMNLKATSGNDVSLGKQDTEDFSMLGVSWSDLKDKAPESIEVRTRGAESGEWTSWRELEIADNTRMEENTNPVGSTAPTWVGPSDGVELKIDGAEGAALPDGMKLNLIDPGKEQAATTELAAFSMQDSTATPTTTATPTPTDSPSVPVAPPSTAPKPPIVSRAGWGADEDLSPDPSEYNADVKAVFVHHTDGVNDYDCADSASIIRGIMEYHINVEGWNDIGYNFLVDKCGKIYEGRKGGVDLPVLGAHTYGWNRESAGIAVLGNYVSYSPSTSVKTSIARIAAWKLGQYGADPKGTVALNAGATQKNYFGTSFTAGTKYTFNRISAHRDGYNTQCPGNSLYSALPTIRSYAADPVSGLAITSLSGASLSGTKYYTKGAVTVNWKATTPSSLIKGYELLVDGQPVASAGGSATSAQGTLAVGTHTVAVRATHIGGKTSTSAAVTVVAETTAPTFTKAPFIGIRGGTASSTSVPVYLSWAATDANGLKSAQLTAPSTATYGPTTTSASVTAKPGTATSWTMRAYDYAGNYGTATKAYTPVIAQESAASKWGTWSTKSSSSYLGGASYSSSSKGASLKWTFTGSSVGWVVSRASTSGQAEVWVDNVKVATVDLKSSTTMYRNIIWAKRWTTSATHTIKIVVVGTSGRPAITTDGIVYVK